MWLSALCWAADEEPDGFEGASPEILESRPFGSSFVPFSVIQPLLTLTGDASAMLSSCFPS